MKAPALFQRGTITKEQKYIDEIKKSSSPESLSISTKLDTMHPWVMRTQICSICSNEVPHLFSRADNYEIAKIH